MFCREHALAVVGLLAFALVLATPAEAARPSPNAHRLANRDAFAKCQPKAETKHNREVVTQGVAQLDSATAGHAARR